MSTVFVPNSLSGQRLFLIGLPGAGKTTRGQALAAELGWRFADLDAEIERETGLLVADFFRLHGEAAFRAVEADTLRRVGLAAPLVLATGGGTPCFHDSMDWLLAHGRVIWLDVPPALIAQQLLITAADATVTRPLLAAVTPVEDTPEATKIALTELLIQTLASRLPYYTRASHHLVGGIFDKIILRQLVGH